MQYFLFNKLQDLASFSLFLLHKLFGRTWTFVSLSFDFQINKGLQQGQECINHIYNLHVGPFILIALIQGMFPEFSLYNIYVQWSK